MPSLEIKVRHLLMQRPVHRLALTLFLAMRSEAVALEAAAQTAGEAGGLAGDIVLIGLASAGLALIAALAYGVNRLGKVVQRLGQRDALTDCWVEPRFSDQVMDWLSRPKPDDGRAYVLVAKLHGMPCLNRTYGVIGADEILRSLAGLLLHEVEGPVGRLSGARFVGTMRAANNAAAAVRAGEIADAFENLRADYAGSPVELSLRLGLCAFSGSRREDIDAAIAHAAVALAQASGSDVNPAVIWQSQPRGRRTAERTGDAVMTRVARVEP